MLIATLIYNDARIHASATSHIHMKQQKSSVQETRGRQNKEKQKTKGLFSSIKAVVEARARFLAYGGGRWSWREDSTHIVLHNTNTSIELVVFIVSILIDP